MFERSPTPELDPTVESGVEDLNRIRIDDFKDSTTGLNDENSANEDRTATVSTKRIITIWSWEIFKKIYIFNTIFYFLFSQNAGTASKEAMASSSSSSDDSVNKSNFIFQFFVINCFTSYLQFFISRVFF